MAIDRRTILSPRATHFETIFSTPHRFEGAAVLAEGVSGEFREHGYWGSMRDRLPIAQVDRLEGAGALGLVEPGHGNRIRVQGHDNLALIRSGQDLFLKAPAPPVSGVGDGCGGALAGTSPH